MTLYDDEFEEVFECVDDANLRKHLGDALRCAAEISGIAKQYPTLVASVMRKAAIIYLASIVEALLHHALIRFNISYVVTDWKYKEINILHTLGQVDGLYDVQIISGKRHNTRKDIRGYVDFNDLIKLCKKEGIIKSNPLFKRLDNVRKLRNRVHIMGLTASDRRISNRTVDSVASTLARLLRVLEPQLLVAGV